MKSKGLVNAKVHAVFVGGNYPTQSPNVRVFAYWWYIGFKVTGNQYHLALTFVSFSESKLCKETHLISNKRHFTQFYNISEFILKL